MPIEIQQKGMAQLYGAAAVVSKAEKEAQRKQDIQMQQQYQQDMKVLDAQLDLEMYERSKRWEIDKMQLRSQMDFQREEQQRQRKLDSADSAIQQIDKEVLAGRITEQEAYPIKQKLELNKLGVNVPISAFPGEGEDRYGVRPYYTDPEFERDFPELAEAKRRDVTEGRVGTVPYHLSPEFLRTLPPSTAQEMLENKGIFFDSDEEFEAWLVNLEGDTPTELPLGDKQLDVGAKADQPELIFKGYGRERIQAGAQVGTLDAATARAILTEAGGDRDRARQIARQRGYSF